MKGKDAIHALCVLIYIKAWYEWVQDEHFKDVCVNEEMIIMFSFDDETAMITERKDTLQENLLIMGQKLKA